MCFYAVASTRKDLSSDVSFTTYWKTDIDESREISFLGVWTDKHNSGILVWKHVSKQLFFKLKGPN